DLHSFPTRRSSDLSCFIKILSIDSVVAAEIIHVHKKAGDVDNVIQRPARVGQGGGDVVDHRAGLFLDIQADDAELIGRGAREAVVGTPRASPRYEDEVAGATVMGEPPARTRLARDDPSFAAHAAPPSM